MTPGQAARGGVAGRHGLGALAAVLAVWLAAGTAVCGAQDVARTARLTGRVVDSLGAPISGATVRVVSQRPLQATTTEAGAFAIDSVPVGRVELGVRRLGYAPATFWAVMTPGVVARVMFTLAPVAIELPAVGVSDTLAHPWLRTFDRRRRAGRGYFFTREDIVRSQVEATTDLLRRVPGVRIVRTRWGTPQVLFDRGGPSGMPCVPQLFVHTMTYMGLVDDFSPDDIEAMEVYNGISTVPVELQSAQAHTCGAIVIWTREPPPVKK
ncbi:MAG: carboxypeptidase-like regulatory domain-containing protein [Gemmatimonadaceae bacterium]